MTKRAWIGIAVVGVALAATACNPESLTFSYTPVNQGGCSSVVSVTLRTRYDGPEPGRVWRSFGDGPYQAMGWAVPGQTFAVDGYLTGGCAFDPNNPPPPNFITRTVTVQAFNMASEKIGTFTPITWVSCSPFDANCPFPLAPLSPTHP